MKQFAELIRTLDSTNKTTLKVEALSHYFKTASDKDKVWTIAILSHRRPPRPVNTNLMRQWASTFAKIPLWLFEESYHIVGDLAETIALVIPPSSASSEKSLNQFLQEMIELKPRSEEEKKEYLYENWFTLNYYERFVFTKLITGSFRIGVSQKLMTRALLKATEIDEDILAYKLMGNWDPATTTFTDLVLEEKPEDYLSKPYPFYLAYAIEDEPETLGDVKEWVAEHKWDGIRSQVIIRNGELFVWSRGEELVTDKYPEFEKFIHLIPDGTVIDGEILPFPKNEIGTFKDLQTRIGRKNITKKLLEKTPVILKAYDLLEWKGEDIREKAYQKRRELLEQLFVDVASDEIPLHISSTISFQTWDEVAKERDRSREVKSEGLMLKRWDSPYLVGRKKGDWWKWKVDPLTIDAVLTYAMRGHGRRSNLFTDYTFGLWDEEKEELVTFAKAYSGLTDAEFRKVDAWIKKNTLERFGPVRSVTPQHVFEIAFEGIAESSRHKSGVATRFPRILRWRHDKKIEEANTLEDLKALIPK
ncbi:MULTISPECIES: ATP-dependent DNA ligase [Mesonia]|uniref:DNA ligase B n=1 Tax=Mesonia oceanica TaxID=2687242 RepID=A0AC61Y3G9_9FLAO|nr:MULTISPECIES: ATP-dependent DNA ligase [Mesonia]MAN26370.1 ATP-dependent DNA ligase [Mesonia sp.]MBJ97506.1 ATP-dependent DNA ligase [Flavobacteriaceae bacterium]VVU98980.1 DNA ligase B [Mesonia oceanica]|tara:strand:+ start:13836 stop:15431 length:1596 start_codon:yes stop_codon:yes gene_type:complete